MKPLALGACIAVVAPAGPAAADAVARVPVLYARHGFAARVYPGCHRRTGYLAGDDAARLADLHAALADPDVAALHALRGGYGCLRLLPHVDAALVRRAHKPLVGYSDVTALHALWRRAGAPVLHAPMPASDLLAPAGGDAVGGIEGHADGIDRGCASDGSGSGGGGSNGGGTGTGGSGSARGADADALFAALRDGLPATLAPPLRPLPGVHRGGVAEGLLVGGNLSLVAALLGTPWAWPTDGALLFLEDINEEAYRVDRLLTQLHLAGALRGVAGVVLGSFHRDGDAVRHDEAASASASTSAFPRDGTPPDDGVAAVLRERLLPLGVPLLSGWPAGHARPNRPLPLGVAMRLDADAGTLTRL